MTTIAPPLPPVTLHNTLSRKVEPVVCREPGKVGIYSCGPTTYDLAHIGHARPALTADLLVRVLRQRGLEVTYVRNITDIDDKILARAIENGETPTALAARMADSYREDMAAIGCAPPTHEPKVSEHVPQIVALIGTLVDNGAAYAVKGEGDLGSDVYFRVRAFAGYGKLSNRRIDDLRSGERVEVDERKEDPLDFALWKGCAPDAWGWSSPWGRGRPGWHIECSAMSEQYLGFGFDIHAGGMDLIFPHHENEIAQSEAARPQQGDFARCWVHNGFLNIDKEKMSKSLGNFFTMKDVLARNDPEAMRLFLLAHHYRGPMQFDVEKLDDGRVIFPGIDESERKIDYLYTTFARAESMTVAVTGGELTKEYRVPYEQIATAKHDALSALAEDLGAATAIAAVYRIAGILNEMLDFHAKRKNDRGMIGRVIGSATRTLRELVDVLGIVRAPQEDYLKRTRVRRLKLVGLDAADIEKKVQERVAARQGKDFAKADGIRAELETLGIELFDGTAGTTWKKGV